MPKVSVYLSDELYREARARELPLSALTQKAVEEALAAAQTDEWVERVRARPRRYDGRIDITRLMDEVRDEFGA